jgi:hypothetical protein
MKQTLVTERTVLEAVTKKSGASEFSGEDHARKLIRDLGESLFSHMNSA